MSLDIRWHQRLQNFEQALKQLCDAADLTKTRKLTDLERQGMIQAFEFTHELGWNVLKDYFEFQGNTSITGSRDAAREGFKMGLLKNGDLWMEMIKSRNQSSHTYNESVALQISEKITRDYLPEFKAFLTNMKARRNGTT